MQYLKLFHVFFLLIWLGGLFSFLLFWKNSSRSFLKHCYFVVDFPAMILAIGFGIALLFVKKIDFKAAWFHAKMTFAFLLILLDVTSAYALSKGVSLRKRIFLAFIVFSCLLGALGCVYLK